MMNKLSSKDTKLKRIYLKILNNRFSSLASRFWLKSSKFDELLVPNAEYRFLLSFASLRD